MILRSTEDAVKRQLSAVTIEGLISPFPATANAGGEFGTTFADELD